MGMAETAEMLPDPGPAAAGANPQAVAGAAWTDPEEGPPPAALVVLTSWHRW